MCLSSKNVGDATVHIPSSSLPGHVLSHVHPETLQILLGFPLVDVYVASLCP